VIVNRRTAIEQLATLGAGTLAAGQAQAQDVPLPLPNPSAPAPVPEHYDTPQGVAGRMNGAQAAVAALCCEGVRCVFGVPGAQNNEFWDAMKSHGVPYLLVTNEASASVMADASARATGEVGVFALIPGPGITNALTGIGEALHDSVPIVGIITDVQLGPGAPIGQVHGLQNAALLRPVCKAVIEVRHASQIPESIWQAYRIALSGEPGPVAVLIPYPHLLEIWHYQTHRVPFACAGFDETAYRKALCLLGDRRHRVGIYAGMGTYAATAQLTAVAELLQAPVATSVSGKGAISDSHPLAVGWGYGAYGTRTAERAFRDVDLVLAVGVKYSEVSTANYAIPKRPHLIHVDANANNLGRNLPTSVGLCADASQFLTRLLADSDAVRRPHSPELCRRIKADRAAERASHQRVEVKHGVDPMYFFACLRHALHSDDLIFVDVTASVHWASEAIDVCGPRRYFTPTNNQSMGWAVPAAIGAQRVCLEKRVVAVTGDGCFLMSGLEASTAARSALPVKFFVLDDGAYHYMQMLQEPTFGRTTATEIAQLDFPALARGLNLAYNCIGSNEDVLRGIGRALCTPAPVLTQVAISYEGRKIRWLEALKDSYIDKLDTRQKVRMASRAVTRRVNPLLVDD
jgi:acetolactate synthase-1/2/3 large subunit